MYADIASRIDFHNFQHVQFSSCGITKCRKVLGFFLELNYEDMFFWKIETIAQCMK